MQTICERFGKQLLQANGQLDRRALRDIIFSSPDKKQWLEDYLHPMIRQEIHRQLDKADSPYTILSAPLLLETDLHQLTDRILVIDTDEKNKLNVHACVITVKSNI